MVRHVYDKSPYDEKVSRWKGKAHDTVSRVRSIVDEETSDKNDADAAILAALLLKMHYDRTGIMPTPNDFDNICKFHFNLPRLFLSL